METEFSDQVMQMLVKSRKFSVLERANVQRIMDENRLTESDYVKPGEAQRIGQLLVSDFLVVGYIDRVEFRTSTQFIQITGQNVTKVLATFKTHFRVVETKSGKIVCAHSILQKLDSQKDIPPRERQDMTPADYRDRLFTDTAILATNYVLEGVYPIKVAAVTGTNLVLNRGEGLGIKPGKRYEIFAQGQVIKDPDTGEVLGSEESKVAEIEVTAVHPKFSKAKVVSSTGTIKVGSICRQLKFVPTPEAPKYPRVSPGW